MSAVGPAGVGKTRLAIKVASAVAGGFAGGVWYVDLVPVTDPGMVATTVATTLRLVETPGQSPQDALVAGLADRTALLILDNCEHLVDSVAVLSERLLSACGRLVVLTTSRTRLVVPFERVYQVPGLSLPDDTAATGTSGDAVELFMERAAAAGSPSPALNDRHRVGAICRALEGSALAIELAAARLPALGWEALEEGLADQIGLLTGGPRMHPRHRSLQETLDWSYQLLDPLDQAVLRRVSVFAAPFVANAAANVVAYAGVHPVHPEQVTGALARLADHSLLVPNPTPGGTRYRALESIRQFGTVQIAATGEREVLARHLTWCLTTAIQLDLDAVRDLDHWPQAFDAVADDLRAALSWSVRQGDHRAEAHKLAHILARLLFLRGRPSEAQDRYEQSAGLTGDGESAALAFRRAAAVAKCRVVGEEALRLERAAADAALSARDGPGAGIALARSAELLTRYRGMFAKPPTAASADTLLAEARDHAHGDQRADAAIMTAAAGRVDPRDPLAVGLLARAVEMARRTGDPLLESSALDALAFVQIVRGDVVDAAATVRHRVNLTSPLRYEPEAAFELKDAYHSGVFTSVGAGDLLVARLWAEQHMDLPFLREERHLASEDLLLPDALAGDWARVLTVSDQFRSNWDRAGRPCAPGRGMAPGAVAMVHGLRGDDNSRAEWLAILAAVRGVDPQHASVGSGYGEVFDAIVALHRGHPEEALGLLAVEPDAVHEWYAQIFRHWRTALRSEAAVLAGHPDAEGLTATANVVTARNPVANLLVRRAEALRKGQRASLLAAASGFAGAGCRYQAARTLVFAGDEARRDGLSAFAAMGAAPMVT